MPDFLAKTRGAYGLLVFGNAMDPAYKNGWTAIVNPTLPPEIGQTCVFRGNGKDGQAPEALIRVLDDFTSTTWHVSQHNPKKRSMLKRSEWPTCHRVMGHYEH
jgi:phage repressor protein C with HTH and peptisase S24 domain